MLRNGFTGYDDHEYVTDNPHVNTGLTRQNVTWAFTAAHSNNWHPLTWISHPLDCTLFGLAPAGHHLTSLLFHVSEYAAALSWLSGVTGSPGRSAFVALAFGLHPLHVESVAWVAERKDVLSTFFGLLDAAGVHRVRADARPRRATWPWRRCFAAGLMSKPMLVDAAAAAAAARLVAAAARGFRLSSEKLPLLRPLGALRRRDRLGPARRAARWPRIDQLPLALRLANAAVSYVAISAKRSGRSTSPSSIRSRCTASRPGWSPPALLRDRRDLGAGLRLAQTPSLAGGRLVLVSVTLLPVIGIVRSACSRWPTATCTSR